MVPSLLGVSQRKLEVNMKGACALKLENVAFLYSYFIRKKAFLSKLGTEQNLFSRMDSSILSTSFPRIYAISNTKGLLTKTSGEVLLTSRGRDVNF